MRNRTRPANRQRLDPQLDIGPSGDVMLADQPVLPFDGLERPHSAFHEITEVTGDGLAPGEHAGQGVVSRDLVGHCRREPSHGLVEITVPDVHSEPLGGLEAGETWAGTGRFGHLSSILHSAR